MRTLIPDKPGKTNLGLLFQHGLSNYTHYYMWDEISYQFPNFKGGTVDVRELISSFSPHFNKHGNSFPYWDQISFRSHCLFHIL